MGEKGIKMVDIYLMQQLTRSLKNKFDLAYENHVNNYANSVDTASDATEIASSADKKSVLKGQIKESVDSYEWDEHIAKALQFLIKDGEKYLSKERFLQLLTCFKEMNEKIAAIDLDQDLPEDMVDFFHLEEDLLVEIYEIGVKKFKEEDYSTSLSCFVLLSSLDSTNVEYWYSEGIVAQKCSKYSLALKAYSKVLELDQESIGALLFSAQCFLEQGLMENAREVMELVEPMENQEGWEEVIAQIQIQLSSSK